MKKYIFATGMICLLLGISIVITIPGNTGLSPVGDDHLKAKPQAETQIKGNEAVQCASTCHASPEKTETVKEGKKNTLKPSGILHLSPQAVSSWFKTRNEPAKEG